MFGRVLTVVTLAAAIVLGLLVQSSTPATTGPIGLLAIFLLLYGILAGILTWLLYWVSLIVVYLAKPVILKKPLHPLTVQHAYYYASVVAFAPIILLAIKSVSQIGLYEILLVISFLALSIFYIKKRLQ